MVGDRWGVGELYEPFMGRWSRRVAAHFVPLLPVPRGADWVDVGCGTGALSAAVMGLADPRSVVGLDPAPGFVDHVRQVITDPRFTAEVADAADLAVATDAADAVVSGLVVNFVPLPLAALEDAQRVVRPGGLVGGYVWDYVEGMGILRAFWDSASVLDEHAGEAAEGARFPLCRPQPLRHLLEVAGLTAIEVTPIDVTAHFHGFEDYWTPFLGGQGPAAGYVARLSEARRAALRDRLRQRLPTAPDGSIELPLRAWAFWGTA